MNNTENINNDDDASKSYRLKAGLFLGTVGSVSALIGFSKTVASAKKHEQKFLDKIPNSSALLEGGTALAMRALGWGTLYAFLGTGTLCYGIWKLSGAQNMEDFKQRSGRLLPKIPRNETPNSRTDFDGLTDLLKYLATWGKE